MSELPRVAVLKAPGINCDRETRYAFEKAGAVAEEVHVSQIEDGDIELSEFQVLMLSGGFSHGDDLGAGRVLALELESRIGDQVERFVEAGKVILGVCNGFQILVKSGLLPDGSLERPQKLSLTDNKSGVFRSDWVRLRATSSVCPFIPDYHMKSTIELPIAHGEGRLVDSFEGKDLLELVSAGQVTYQYRDADNKTQSFPNNPNGSEYGIAGVCSPSGLIMGMMPHPERFVEAEDYVNWRRAGAPIFGEGLPLFEKIVEFVEAA